MKKKIDSEIDLRIEDAYDGRWFSIIVNREKERQVGIFNKDDSWCIAVSEEMIPQIMLGLTALMIEFKTGEKGKLQNAFNDKMDAEVDELVYNVYKNDVIEVSFLRNRKGRDGVIQIDWTSVAISVMMASELHIGLTKAQKMLSGDNF